MMGTLSSLRIRSSTNHAWGSSCTSPLRSKGSTLRLCPLADMVSSCTSTQSLWKKTTHVFTGGNLAPCTSCLRAWPQPQPANCHWHTFITTHALFQPRNVLFLQISWFWKIQPIKIFVIVKKDKQPPNTLWSVWCFQDDLCRVQVVCKERIKCIFLHTADLYAPRGREEGRVKHVSWYLY